MVYPAILKRHKTNEVKIGNVTIGGNNPVVVQSMTNTDTSNVEATTNQIIELYNAGSEIVRITVNNDHSARAVPKIYESLLKKGYDIPLVGCFHYNGHRLLTSYPDCAKSLAKYRINPGNVGFGEKRDKQFEIMINTALKYNKPIRIGVNWGSIDQDLSKKIMDDNSKKASPKSSDEILREILVTSAITSANRAIELGLPENKIVVSCKVSRPTDLLAIYKELASKTNYALHLGLTEAGMGSKGMIASSVALSMVLSQGIGDTIRVSITPKPGEARTQEVEICKEILQSLGLKTYKPEVSSCPGCGRTTSSYFQELASTIENFLTDALPKWKEHYPGSENLKIAVMGCIVNGPGESKHADIGISLPGTGESPSAPVFIDGERYCVLKGDNIAEEFKDIITQYVAQKYGVVN